MSSHLDVARELYPFRSRFFDRGSGIKMHYVDEGQGDPVVMVHGNPTWSFYYRDLIKALSPTHRVIAVDHVGMGLSDKPRDDAYHYTLGSRIDDLDALLAHLGVTGRATLVVHDWGGAIGVGWAVRHPGVVRRLVILNTAAFHNPPGKPLPRALWLARDTRVGALLVERLNAFARGAVFLAMTRRKMPADVRRGYLAPYEPPGDRIATLRFVQDIPLDPADPSHAEISKMQSLLPSLEALPALVCWGMRDFVFDEAFLAEWRRRLTNAEFIEYPTAGHYILEDAADLVIPRVVAFLQANPIAP